MCVSSVVQVPLDCPVEFTLVAFLSPAKKMPRPLGATLRPNVVIL